MSDMQADFHDGVILSPGPAEPMPDWHLRFDSALAGILRRRGPADGPVRVLEAGGGSGSYLNLRHKVHLTTIDISPEQIERNTSSDVAILGDLATHAFGDSRFDIVVCWNVLEHVSDVPGALAHLVGTLAPGGLLVVRGPDPHSIKGLITALTPHWVHVAFYRRVLGQKNAGLPGFAPFPTVLESAACPGRMRGWMVAAGLRIVYADRFVGDHAVRLRQRYPLLHAGYTLAGWLTRQLTGGRFGSELSDMVLVAQKPPAR